MMVPSAINVSVVSITKPINFVLCRLAFVVTNNSSSLVLYHVLLLWFTKKKGLFFPILYIFNNVS